MSLKLNGATSGSIELDVPAAIGSDISFTLPGADGSAGQVLKTNGSGSFSFIPAGKFIQTVRVDANAETQTTNNSGNTDLSGMSATITIQDQSKLLVFASAECFGANGGSADWRNTGYLYLNINGTNVDRTSHIGPKNAGETEFSAQHNLLHLTDAKPAGTYTIKTQARNVQTATLRWNRNFGSDNNTLIIMEIRA